MAEAPFSLLLPVYSGDDAGFLRAAFDSSVGDQTAAPAQVLIVRDGPVGPDLADALADLAREDAGVTVLELPENVGLGEALNRGLAACEHDLVGRMDADDLSLPDRFALQLEAMASGLDLVGTGLLEFEGDLDHVVGRRVPPTGERIVAYSRFHQPFNHPTVMYRRAAVEAAGGYLPMGRMEDYWLFARMIHGGARTDNLPEPLLGYRVDAGAYHRRGGGDQLRSEIALQRAFRRLRFTSRSQMVRNLAIRGGYRLIPTGVRRIAYRGTFGR